MIRTLRSFTKTLPLLIIALLLSVAVWIMAVTSSDPSVEKLYPNMIPVEIIGQGSNLVIINELPDEISLTLRAPSSIWDNLISQKVPVRAIMDLSGLVQGSHIIPIQIQIGIKPVEIISFSPQSATVEIDTLQTREIEIRLINQGALAVGYQTNPAVLSKSTVLISGAKTYVDKVVEVRAVVKLTDAKTDISQLITLVPVDANGSTVKEVSLSPERITVNQRVFERGGYRNMVVKVVTNGQVDDGYRLSSLSVFPPTVTVYSTDTVMIDGLPGYIETKPIDLSKKAENFEEQIDLNLPDGVQVIDDLYVLVRVEITPIIGNLSLDNVPVEAMGLDVELEAEIIPQQVSAILSGPLNILQKINLADLRILLDLSGLGPGTYTLEPDYVLNRPDIEIESISPKTFNVIIK